ncbi:hypothetical protein STEG23_035859, partial [Scotinomys teguina]
GGAVLGTGGTSCLICDYFSAVSVTLASSTIFKPTDTLPARPRFWCFEMKPLHEALAVLQLDIQTKLTLEAMS